MKRFLTLLLTFGLAAAMLSGCGSTAESQSGQPALGQTIQQTETSAGAETDQSSESASGQTDKQTGTVPFDDGQEWELAERIAFDAADVQTSRMSYRYNDHGDMCRYESYLENDVFDFGWTAEYSYLPDGRVSSIHYIRFNGVEYTESYNWDPSGRIAYIDTTYDDGSTGDSCMKAYDEQGRLIEESDGTYQWYITYTGTEKREKRYWISDDTTNLTVRKYNKDEKVEEIREYEATGFTDCTEDDLTKYTVYDFDKYGRQCGYTDYSADGTVIQSSTYTYEADGHSYLSVRCDAEGNKIGGTRYVYKPISEVTES